MSQRRNFNIRREIRKYGSDILKSDNFRSSANNIQHSNVSVMKHSMKVAYTGLWIAHKFKIKCNRSDLVRGALLHDYFLYDWHDKNHPKLHGVRHAGFAAKNADADFGLTKKEYKAIRAHMFPLGIRIPSSREAIVLTLADKYCAAKESLSTHRNRRFLKRQYRK